MRNRERVVRSAEPRGPAGRILAPGFVLVPYTEFYSGDGPEDTWGCTTKYSRYEFMSDASPSYKNSYQPILHYKAIAGPGSPYYASYSGIYDLVGDIRWERPCVIPSIQYMGENVVVPMSEIDWDSALISLAREIKGLVQTKTLLGVSMKELPETFRMVSKPFKLLKPLWRSIAKDRTARSLAKEGANIWLEGTYGWGASYYDLQTFCKSVEKYTRANREFTSRAGSSVHQRVTTTVDALPPTCPSSQWVNGGAANPFAFAPNLPLRCIFSPGSVQGVVSCSITERIQNQADSLERLLDAFGLTGNQALQTLWEATPYSFVVDWFLNTKKVTEAFQIAPAMYQLESAHVSCMGYSAKARWSYTARFIPEMSTSWPSLYWMWARTGTSQLTDALVGTGVVEAYQRCVGFPSGSGSWLTKEGLKLSQWASGFALLTRFL